MRTCPDSDAWNRMPEKHLLLFRPFQKQNSSGTSPLMISMEIRNRYLGFPPWKATIHDRVSTTSFLKSVWRTIKAWVADAILIINAIIFEHTGRDPVFRFSVKISYHIIYFNCSKPARITLAIPFRRCSRKSA